MAFIVCLQNIKNLPTQVVQDGDASSPQETHTYCPFCGVCVHPKPPFLCFAGLPPPLAALEGEFRAWAPGCDPSRVPSTPRSRDVQGESSDFESTGGKGKKHTSSEGRPLVWGDLPIFVRHGSAFASFLAVPYEGLAYTYRHFRDSFDPTQ